MRTLRNIVFVGWIGLGSLTGCGGVQRENEGGSGGGGETGQGGAGGATVEPAKIERIDLVLAIDNSRSMGDKQQLLALAVPDLVESLVNPPCLDPSGTLVKADGPLAACPEGFEREFPPVTDIHIGIVSSSLGGHGSDSCNATTAGKTSNDDRAHLLSRLDPANPGLEEPTYLGLDFLAWDPKQALVPPGEADVLADSDVDDSPLALVPSLRNMVLGVGQIGCGYEAQLESVYRFLVDPDPYQTIALDDDLKAVPSGTDEVLLEQRRAFLRPDSLVAVVLLTDENDCSIRDGGEYYYGAQQKNEQGGLYNLPRARAICETNPNDACCFSCGQQLKDGCPEDPTCTDPDGTLATHDSWTDHINVRCHDQKRRFGIDFLYPVERYVRGLTDLEIADRHGFVVDNPLFADIHPEDGVLSHRDPNNVILAALVGVPWQDLARTNAAGVPDLNKGLDGSGAPTGGLKTASEMNAVLPQGFTTWDLILGDPDNLVPPLDPLMIESMEPRSGQNPILGEAGGTLVTSDTPLANLVNGHEYDTSNRDLQYACIFPLVKAAADGSITPDVRDCTQPNLPSCDCQSPDSDNPLCTTDPATGEDTLQVRAKAYPGARVLRVVKGLGERGVAGSVCPAQLTDPTGRDFGYRPAVRALVEQVKSRL